jgi:ribose/xylose/arabinose/galactoside ABC-type transport system permease subunit
MLDGVSFFAAILRPILYRVGGRSRPSGPVLGLLGVLTLFVLLLAWENKLGYFLRLENVQIILHRNCVTAVAALGMLLVIVSGGIDLSVGSVVALVTVTAMQVYRMVYDGPEHALPEALLGRLEPHGLLWKGTGSVALASAAAIVAGVGVGGICGWTNGMVVTRLRVAPFVATLGMMSIARGLAVWLAGRTRISFRGALPEWVLAIGSTRSPYLVDPGVRSALLLAAAMWIVLRYTVFGRYCFAIGSNEATARLCGVRVDRHKVWIYTLAGLLAGWAGILVFAQNGAGDPNSSVGLELDVIAAVVIGGAALTGGQGTISGTLLGVLILGLLENGVSFFDVPVEVKYILIGVIVIVNTALSGWQRKRDVS